MKLSIVTTLYQSAPYVEEFYQRATAVAHQLTGDDYEIIMVNDGSPDNSLELAVALFNKDQHVRVVDLSRNFGHHKAIMTGLAYARGDRVFLIDSDLEEEPEWLLPFASKMENEGCDVVYGVQEKRKGGWAERWSGQVFYRLFNLVSGLSLPENIVTARLMTSHYVKALVSHTEREIFLAGLWHITGFDQHSYEVRKHSSSASTYTISRKIAILVNSIAAFSNKPLLMIFYTGFFISCAALGYVVYLLINRFFFSTPLSGWTSTIASIWLIGGMNISFLGIIGIYLAKIYSETKQRPYTIIRQIYEEKQ